MPFVDLGTGQGRTTDCAVRWDESTAVVEVKLFRFPVDGDSHWIWVKVGTAKSTSLAIMTAHNYLRGKSE